jgi:hypothetical protein
LFGQQVHPRAIIAIAFPGIYGDDLYVRQGGYFFSCEVEYSAFA